MFFGEYRCVLDKTGKVTIPKKFREWLKIGEVAIILARDSCLCIYPWEKYEGSEKLVKGLSERRFTRLIFPQEAIKEVDKWGRIYIPVGLRKYANIEQRKVVFIGCNKYFEILNEEKRAEGRREEISWRDPLGELRSLEQRRESIEKELEDVDRELEKMIEEPTREHLMVKHQEAIVIIRKIEGLIAELKKLELNIISKF